MSRPLKYTFKIEGKIKPYVRMTQKSKYVNEQAQEYLACKDSISYQVKNQMAWNNWDMFPHKTALMVQVRFHVSRHAPLHKSDLDNLLKTIFDSMNKIVYTDDCWIDAFDVWRMESNEQIAITYVHVMPLVDLTIDEP